MFLRQYKKLFEDNQNLRQMLIEDYEEVQKYISIIIDLLQDKDITVHQIAIIDKYLKR